MRVIQPGLESLAQLHWSYLPSIFFFLCKEDHLNSLQGLAPMQSIEIFLIFHVHAENYGNIRKEFHQKLFLHGQPAILSISKLQVSKD